eukprot:scaffold13062_cov129-Isochrysis_galbana.AAC.2
MSIVESINFARGLRDCERTDPAEKRRREGAVSKRGPRQRGPFFITCLAFSSLVQSRLFTGGNPYGAT